MHVSASSMKVNINRLMVDPEFYLFDCSKNTEHSEFLIITEQLLELAPFIDSRLAPFARGQFSVSTRELAELVRHSPLPRPAQHFIFHHAFVCSTLLARCLSQSRAFFSLKEPHILRKLADLRRSKHHWSNGEPGSDWGRLLKTHLGLLSKNYSRGDTVIVKATNVANNLMPDILTDAPESKLVYMFCSLEEFLVSNLKKAEDTRQKIPALFHLTAADANFFSAYPAFRTAEERDFLEYCALLWLASNHNFLMQAEAAPPGRVCTLAMNAFLESPREVLSATSRFFGFNANASELDSMTANAVMQRHAKDPNLVYNKGSRERENAAIRLRFGKEISQTALWLARHCNPEDIYSRLEQLSLLAARNNHQAPTNMPGGLERPPVRISSRS